jgi:hypothetical protein
VVVEAGYDAAVFAVRHMLDLLNKPEMLGWAAYRK